MTSNNLYLIAHQFNPESLRLARELRVLQKIELAIELEVSPSAITQFENGAIKPNPTTIAKMSLALGFPATFFAEQGVQAVSSDQCHFRKLQSSSQWERRKMLGVSTIVGRFIDFVENYIELPPEQVTPFMQPKPMNRDEVEHAAMQVRRAWGLGNGPIHNLIDLLEGKGIIVLRLLGDCSRVDAFSLYYKHRPIIFLNTAKDSTSRTRFDAAHELGHLILHGDSKPGDEDQEHEADAFASAFLLPKDGFAIECPRRLVWEHFLALKGRWRVSLRALVRRARDLGMLSEHTYKRAQIHFSQFGWQRIEPEEPPVEWPSSLKQSIGVMCEAGWTLQRIAEEISVNENDLRHWIFADDEDAAMHTLSAEYCLPDALVARRKLREQG